MTLFYTNQIEANTAYLSEEEARHCIQVLRKKVGDRLQWVDGRGGFYEGQITETGKKKCIINIQKHIPTFQKRDYHIHIAIAPTKNIHRLEWFLEKTTEIGIDSITPILCQRSERKKIRLDRLEKILVAAMKQSLKAYLPDLQALTPFNQFIEQKKMASTTKKFIAHCNNGFEKLALKDNYQTGKDVCILIGPEGDFSPKEIQLAVQYGFSGASLGKSRLRTETAGIVACHTIHLLNDF